MRKSKSLLATKSHKKIRYNEIVAGSSPNSNRQAFKLEKYSTSNRELPGTNKHVIKLFQRLFLNKNKRKTKCINHKTKLSLKINPKINSHITQNNQNKVRFLFKNNNNQIISPKAIIFSSISSSVNKDNVYCKQNSKRFNTANNNIKIKTNIVEKGWSCDNDYINDNISFGCKNNFDENTTHQTLKTEIYTPSEYNNPKKFNFCQITPNNIYNNYKNNNINISNNSNHFNVSNNSNYIHFNNNKNINKPPTYIKNNKQYLNRNNVINKKNLILDYRNIYGVAKKNSNKSLMGQVAVYMNNSADKKIKNKKIFSSNINKTIKKNTNNNLNKLCKEEKNNKKTTNNKKNSSRKTKTKKIKRKVLSIKINNSSSKIGYVNFTKTFYENSTPIAINLSSILVSQSSKNKTQQNPNGNKYINLKSSFVNKNIKKNLLISGNYLHNISQTKKSIGKKSKLSNLKGNNFEFTINYDNKSNKINKEYKEFPVHKTNININNLKKFPTKNNIKKKTQTRKEESNDSSLEKTIVEDTCKVQVLKNYFQIAKKNLKEITIRKYSNYNNLLDPKVFYDFNINPNNNQSKIRNTVYSNNIKNEIYNNFNFAINTNEKTMDEDEQISSVSIKKLPFFSSKTVIRHSIIPTNLLKQFFFNYSCKKYRENIEKFLTIKDILILSSVSKDFYINMKHIIFNYFFKRIIKSNYNNSFLTKIFQSVFKYSSLKTKNKTELKKYYSMNINKNKSVYNETILKDLPRTFPDEKSFDKENINYTKLYNLLISYSNFNKKIGYAQGLNFLFATAIFIFKNEEEIFIFTDGLINLLKLENYLGVENKNLIQKIEELSLILNKYLPELVSFLKKKCLNHEFFTTGWILTLFSNVMDRKCLLIVWGFMIIFGWKFFYCFIIQILCKFKDSILSGNEQNLSVKMRTLLRDKEFINNFDEIIINTFLFMKNNISL